MVVYTVGGQRRVAHVASSSKQNMDCKQTFLTWLNNTVNATLVGWFQPYVDRRDYNTKMKAYRLFRTNILNYPNGLVTFGVVNAAN